MSKRFERVVNFRLPAAVWEGLQWIAQRDQVTVSDVIRRAIVIYVQAVISADGERETGNDANANHHV